ncbi:hypothetical protein NRIC0766_05150 [Lactobacillus delbrueckii subsp. allosunkii]|nr:hypothetical protein NRIC0766_05140 [Lactobacillus delbrueckii subsp. sunkii]GHN12384.1 hypothetical protein NRIC0766_05150 [Lactobacillus delbrueckii subsp. sunkii]
MIAKKISEKIKSPVLFAIPLGKRAEIPVSKGTVKQRGMAKKGPMVKYKRQVKK